MVLGMPLPVFTTVHVALSLIGIGSGLVVLLGMLGRYRLDILTVLFLVTTVLTSITGFFFPFHGFTPGIILGILSLIALAAAIYARYVSHLAGRARSIYVVSSVVALYFNVFVLIAQSFQKIPALKGLPASQGTPAFLTTQIVVLLVFIVLGVRAVKKFYPAPAI